MSTRRISPRFAIAISLTLAVLGAACGGSSSNGGTAPTGTDQVVAQLPVCPIDALAKAPGPVEITVWHFLAAKTGETLEKLANEYNASQSKVRVKVENQGNSNDEVWNKYTAGIKANDLPAIVILDDTVTEQVIDSETVLPAQSCINADKYDMGDFMETAKQYYTVNGVLYPASLNLSGALFYYNKNHFRRAGLDASTTPKTLAEVRDYATKLKTAGVVDKPVVLNLGPPLIEMWLTGAGIPIVDNENGRGAGTTKSAAFDTPETVEFYRWVNDMVRDGLLDALPNTSGQVNHYLSMANQKASMTIETSTAATSIEAFLSGQLNTAGVPGVDPAQAEAVDTSALDIGAGEVPGLKAQGRLQMGGGAWYMTRTGSPESQGAAWDFMKFINSLNSQVTWNIEGSYLPYRTSATSDPRLQDKWKNTLAGQWLAIAHRELTDGVDPRFPGPLLGPYEDFRKAIRSSTDAMLFQGVSPDKAVADASKKTTDALTQYQEGGF